MTARSATSTRHIKKHPLAPYAVDWAEPMPTAIKLFMGQLKSGANSVAMRSLFRKYPSLLVMHLKGTEGRWVVPNTIFQIDRGPEFYLAEKSSDNYEWTTVALCNADEKLLNRGGYPTRSLRNAATSAMAISPGKRTFGRKPPKMQDLLDALSQWHGITSSKPTDDERFSAGSYHVQKARVVLIGRDGDDIDSDRDLRRKLGWSLGERPNGTNSGQILIRSYDWLLATISERKAAATVSPPQLSDLQKLVLNIINLDFPYETGQK